MTIKRTPDQLSEMIDNQLAQPTVTAVLLSRADAERIVEQLDDLADRLADEAAMEAALFQLEGHTVSGPVIYARPRSVQP